MAVGIEANDNSSSARVEESGSEISWRVTGRLETAGEALGLKRLAWFLAEHRSPDGQLMAELAGPDQNPETETGTQAAGGIENKEKT
jgi:hypothetical protein